jgi:tetratricopeptide (TPR) repeat protein
MKTLAATLLICLFAADLAQAQTTRERGFGPYTLVTSRGSSTVRLLRREGDFIWVDRMVQSSNWVETGVPRKEIVEFRASRPRLFELADKAESPEQIAGAIDQLRRMVSQLRAFRDLPGIPVNEAILLIAQLNERREYWREALQHYEELLGQGYEMKERPVIRYRAGLCLWKMDQKERALAYLLDDPIPDDDYELLSSVLNARADSLASAGRHREAIDTYLSMIVFYPYVQENEPRALAGILPSYIALEDWDAVMKAIEDLQRDYAGTPHAAAANEVMASHAKKVESEKQFQLPQE